MTDHGGLTRLLRIRYPVLVLLAVATCVGLGAWLGGGGEQGDVPLETWGGAALFGLHHGGGLHVYVTQPLLQIGPLPLAVMGLALRGLGHPAGQVLLAVLTLGCAPVAAWAVERTAVAVGVERRRAAGMALFGGVCMLGAFFEVAKISHLEDAFAVTGVLLAVATVAERRAWWVPAIPLGLAVSCKPWAIIAAPILLQLDRDRAKAVLLAAVTAGAPWLPFVVADPHTVTSLSLDLFVWPHSVLRMLGFDFGDTAPAASRALGMAFGLCFAALVARRGRWLAVPLAGFAGRLMLEPTWFLYYGALAVAGALLWDLRCSRRVPTWTLWTLAAEYAVQMALPWDDTLGAVVNFIYALSVISLVVMPALGVAGHAKRPPLGTGEGAPRGGASYRVDQPMGSASVSRRGVNAR